MFSYHRSDDLFFLEYNEPLFDFEPLPFSIYENRERDSDKVNLKEIKSNNDNFIQEKNIKFELYPLFINWKKIETREEKNEDFNIFKLFGYFGAAIFELLKQVNGNKEYNYKNFISELNNYKKVFRKRQLEENEFYKKLFDIYDKVVSLIKNKIIIFKEISVFITVLRLYENYFFAMNDITTLIETLKMQFIIINKLEENEYKKIYDSYFKKYKIYSDDSEDEYENDIWLWQRNNYFPKSRKNYINHLKIIFKKKKNQIILNEH